jgi:hypothetical protein
MLHIPVHHTPKNGQWSYHCAFPFCRAESLVKLLKNGHFERALDPFWSPIAVDSSGWIRAKRAPQDSLLKMQNIPISRTRNALPMSVMRVTAAPY